jgi:DDE superfamily endonuclease
MGVNIQAVCDSRLRFIYFATAAPGGTPDISAYRNVSLFDLVVNLPAGFHVVADAAYILSEQTVTPYTGADRHGVNDIVNFYISQVRIRIEMAFGRLTTKWRILRCAESDKLWKCVRGSTTSLLRGRIQTAFYTAPIESTQSTTH